MEISLAVSIFSSLILLFYFRYFFTYQGYPGFGNFILPLNSNDLNWTVFFNPYQFDTTLNTTPESSFFLIVMGNVPLLLLSHIFTGINNAARAYVFLSTLFFMLSTYSLSGRLTRNFLLKVSGSIFLTFNPFMLMLLSSGDSLGVVSQGFVLLSLFFLIRGIQLGKKLPNLNWLFSVMLLVFTITGFQSFILGSMLYAITFLFFNYECNALGKRFIDFGLNAICFLGCTFILVLVLILPDIYPLFASGVTTQFVFNPGLGSFIGNSVSPVKLLMLEGYPPNLAWISVRTLGDSVFYFWSFLTIFILMFLLVSPILTKKKRFLYLSFVAITLSFVAAGANSIFFPLTSFLYIHFPGYAALNASYFWEFPISVIYFYLLLLVAPKAFSMESTAFPDFSRILYRRTSLRRPLKAMLPIFIIAVVVMLLLPISAQGYYNGDYGINNLSAKNMPKSYYSISQELNTLADNSSGGVAYFNPDVGLYFNNTSNWFSNPLISFPTIRTAELSYYGAPHTPSNRFFFWVYSLFYQNKTRYLGELMALGGIQYFVVLNNTNSWSYAQSFIPFSEGVNSTLLMNYQYGVVEIFTGNGYGIYRNLNYTGTSASVSNLTLVGGGFHELSILPYFGFNLSKLGLVFTSDINKENYNQIMDNLSSIIVPNRNSFYGIILPSVSSPIYASDYAMGTTYEGSWESSLNVPQSVYYVLNDVKSSAFTQGNASMNLPLGISTTGSYTIWFQIYYSSSVQTRGGMLNVTAGNITETFHTDQGFEGLTNSFVWQSLNATLTPGSTIRFTSAYGWNAVRLAYVVPYGTSTSVLDSLTQLIERNNISVVQIMGGESVIQDLSSSYSDQQQSVSMGSGNFPNGAATFISSEPGYDNTLSFSPTESSGTLYLKLLHFAYSGGLFEVISGNQSFTMGYSAQNYSSPLNSTDFYISIPIEHNSGVIELKLISENYTLFIVGIVFSSSPLLLGNAMILNSSPNLTGVSSSNGRLTQTDVTSNVTTSGNSLVISGDVNYAGPSKSYQYVPIVTLYYNFPFSYNHTLSEDLAITNGYFMSFNSLFLGNTNSTFITSSSGGLGSLQIPSTLTLNIYTTKPISANTSITITFTLRLTFYDIGKVYDPHQDSQLQQLQEVQYRSSGFNVHGHEGIVLVRLPFYSQMVVQSSSAERFSSLSSLNQMLFTKGNSTIEVDVIYVKNVVNLAYADTAVITVVFLISLYNNPRFKKHLIQLVRFKRPWR